MLKHHGSTLWCNIDCPWTKRWLSWQGWICSLTETISTIVIDEIKSFTYLMPLLVLVTISTWSAATATSLTNCKCVYLVWSMGNLLAETCSCISSTQNIIIYSEYVMGDSDISYNWKTGSNTWRLNESYFAGMSIYVWYASAIHYIFYISNMTLQ